METPDLIGEILKPQFELIVALSGLERVIDARKDYYDRHHLFFYNHRYKTRTERQFRELFQVTIHRPIHDELHAQLPPPDQPTKDEMEAVLERYRQGDWENQDWGNVG